jgi:3-methyladenine DNA glycosylase/8-oxoguanine DNA glycosylase
VTRGEGFQGKRVYTIGHSTRTVDELVESLRRFNVTTLVDIRTIPRSRHNPQFNEDALSAALAPRQLRYAAVPELGGLRRTRPDSPNQGFRNQSFRGYADYMLTAGFEAGLSKLLALSAESTLALMCAEAVPWRCHRSLVADALVVRGAEVAHITSAARASPHRLTRFAQVEGTRITYPWDDASDEPLATEPPFHLEATVRVLQRRPSNRVDVWDEGRYLRVLRSDAELALVEVRNQGTVDRPDVRLRVRVGQPSASARAAFARTLRRTLGLDVQLDPAAWRVRGARTLRSTALALRGMRPPRFPELFETFANVVPFQQVSLDAGVATVTRLVERFGESVEHDGRRFYAFPRAGAIAGARLDRLRKAGLSTRKAAALRELARLVASGVLSEDKLAAMSTPEAQRLLTTLPGIGPWSADLVLLRGLGRLDVFPPGDVGALRGLRALLRPASEASLRALTMRFGDSRGLLYFYALGGSLLERRLIHAAPVPK